MYARAQIAAAKGDYTCITFTPDLKKFGLERLDDDTVALFTRRAYDVAGCLKSVKVFLNNEVTPGRRMRARRCAGHRRGRVGLERR